MPMAKRAETHTTVGRGAPVPMPVQTDMTKSASVTKSESSEDTLTLVTLGKASQSTTYNKNFKAENALNDNVNSFSHTLKGEGEWWKG